ncbi:hypothetical protein HYW44_02540 [Candidatus Daviesbacteria bacterium]|nr:hypothetical protein [Candidatus Daviesbacteria bacterium]
MRKRRTSDVYLVIAVLVSLLIGFFFGIKYQNSSLNPSAQTRNQISSINPAKKSDIPTKWAKYKSPTNAPVQFRLEYPSEWKVDNLYIEGGHTVPFSPDDITKAPITVEDYISNDTLNQYTKQYYCHDKNSSCPDEKGVINIKVNGLEAKRLVPYGEINSVTTVVKKGNSFVMLTVSLLSNNTSNYTDEALLKIFDHMSSTITF